MSILLISPFYSLPIQSVCIGGRVTGPIQYSWLNKSLLDAFVNETLLNPCLINTLGNPSVTECFHNICLHKSRNFETSANQQQAISIATATESRLWPI